MKLKKMILAATSVTIGFSLGLAIVFFVGSVLGSDYRYHVNGFSLSLAIAFLIGFVCRYYVVPKVSKG